METKAKSNSVITTEVDGSRITFNVQGAGSLELDMEVCSESVLNRATVHGLKQRISDAAALARDTKTGRSATPAEKFAAMQELVLHYMSGTSEWSTRREGAGSQGGILLQALCAMRPDKSADDVRAFLQGISKSDQVRLLNSEKVRPFADVVREKMGQGIDADEMLSGL